MLNAVDLGSRCRCKYQPNLDSTIRTRSPRKPTVMNRGQSTIYVPTPHHLPHPLIRLWRLGGTIKPRTQTYPYSDSNNQTGLILTTNTRNGNSGYYLFSSKSVIRSTRCHPSLMLMVGRRFARGKPCWENLAKSPDDQCIKSLPMT